MNPIISDLSYVNAPPSLTAHIRRQPEDFQVIEELGFVPDGVGEHSFLRIRKRDANTQWVAERIAAFAQQPVSAVSYAGMKDRHAVTEQWFSVHLPGRLDPDWSACGDEYFSVLQQQRHSRKLRRGALKGNSFRIVLRELQGDRVELEARLQRVLKQGVPNYYGEQRFGRQGGNLAKAQALFSGRRVRNRHQRGLYLSAARSWLFNQVLSRRLSAATWNQILPGDLMMLEGSHSVFPVTDVDADLQRRLLELDIHPTGPLWGQGMPFSQGEVQALETEIAAQHSDLAEGLVRAGLKQERRALRLCVQNLMWNNEKADVLVLHFRLSAGAYATMVLRELVLSSDV